MNIIMFAIVAAISSANIISLDSKHLPVTSYGNVVNAEVEEYQTGYIVGWGGRSSGGGFNLNLFITDSNGIITWCREDVTAGGVPLSEGIKIDFVIDIPPGVTTLCHTNHCGTVDIYSTAIWSFFYNQGIDNYVDSIHTFGSSLHSDNVVEKFDDQWISSLYAPYAALYERVYYGSAGPSNSWSYQEYGGTSLPDIDWNKGWGLNWYYHHEITNKNVLVINETKTNRYKEWLYLMGLVDGVINIVDNREIGLPLMTRGHYWRGKYESQTIPFPERVIYWSSQDIPCARDIPGQGWSDDWRGNEISDCIMPLAALATGQSGIHYAKFSVSPGIDIPPMKVIKKISRKHPNAFCKRNSYNWCSNSFEECISEKFNLNEGSDRLKYNDVRTKRFVNDCYSVKETSDEETETKWYSSNVATASRALAMMDRTFEIVNSTKGNNFIPHNTSTVCNVTGYYNFKDTYAKKFVVEGISGGYGGGIYLNTVSVDPLIIFEFPKNCTPCETYSRFSEIECSPFNDYAYCSGISHGYSGTSIVMSTGTNMPNSGCFVDPRYFNKIEYSDELVEFKYHVIGVSDDDILLKYSLGGTNYIDGVFKILFRHLVGDKFYMNFDCTANMTCGYEYHISNEIGDLVKMLWNYAGPSKIAFTDERVGSSMMSYFSGVLLMENPPWIPSTTPLQIIGEVPDYTKETCGILGNFSFTEELGWKELLANLRNSARFWVRERVRSRYDSDFRNATDFVKSSAKLSSWSYSDAFVRIPQMDLDFGLTVGKISRPYNSETHYAKYDSHGNCLGFVVIVETSPGVYEEKFVDLYLFAHIDMSPIIIKNATIEPPILLSNIPNSTPVAADSCDAVVISTDWKWKNLKYSDSN